MQNFQHFIFLSIWFKSDDSRISIKTIFIKSAVENKKWLESTEYETGTYSSYSSQPATLRRLFSVSLLWKSYALISVFTLLKCKFRYFCRKKPRTQKPWFSFTLISPKYLIFILFFKLTSCKIYRNLPVSLLFCKY